MAMKNMTYRNLMAVIRKIQAKNWYASLDDVVITVNATRFTIITAHRNMEDNE